MASQLSQWYKSLGKQTEIELKLDVESKSLKKIVCSLLGPSEEVGVKRMENSALLYGIDFDDLVIKKAANQQVSSHLDRYGEEWYVDSDEVKAVAPLKSPVRN